MRTTAELRASPRGNLEMLKQGEMRATTVNGRREMLPADPEEVARILRGRRSNTPAARAKAKMAAEAKKRGLK